MISNFFRDFPAYYYILILFASPCNQNPSAKDHEIIIMVESSLLIISKYTQFACI